LECEAEFPGEPRTYLFHAACFEAWQTERVTELVCAVCGHPNDGAPGATVNGDRVHATCAAGSNGDGAAAGAPTSTVSGPPARPDNGVSRASWPVRLLHDVSGSPRRSAREVIDLIAPQRRAGPR